MPIYTYHCDNCDHEFDKHQSFSDEALTICPICAEQALRKVYSPAGVVFKGSGFYVTDKRAPKSSSKTASKAKSTDTKKDASKAKPEKSSTPEKTTTAEAKSS